VNELEAKRMSFDEKIGKKVFSILSEMWAQKRGIYQKAVLPQNRYPSLPDKREYANWLFYASLPMRGGIISDTPFRWIWALKQSFPELFEPEEVFVNWPPEKIAKAFKAVTPEILNGSGVGDGGGGLGMHMTEHAKHWRNNSEMLYHHWGGDIRNVFWGVTEFEEAFRRIDYYHNKAGFRGMRRKIFSLLVAWLQEKELIRFFPAPIPVDFHAFRIFWATEVINFGGYAKPFVPKEKHPPQLANKIIVRISETHSDQTAIWTQKFMQKHGFSHLDMSPAVWILGRTLCAENFQNTSRKDGRLFFEAEDLEKNLDLWPKNYRDPCVSCPLNEMCNWAIPSSPYYRWGILVRIGKRVFYRGHSRRLPFNWKDVLYINTKKRP